MRRVRRLIAQVAGVSDDHPAVLIASELATNAVRHAKTPFEVAVSDEKLIRIEVVDQAPMTAAVTDSSMHGLGMRIVDQLSDCWGANEIKGDGKIIWAEVVR